MKRFDTKVQLLKYRVLCEVAKQAWNDTLLESILEIPKMTVLGKQSTMCCCVYKERAILAERVKMAMGLGRDASIIQIIDIACDECPATGYEVTSSCRGCLAHRCEEVCKRGAISFDHSRVVHIDKAKCVECGMCAKVCPFSAIANRKRPYQDAHKVKAITISKDNAAAIDEKKCIQCGACIYRCLFGAITDRSYILNVIDMIRKSNNNQNYKVFAVVVPTIASQFTYAKYGQVVKELEELGFDTIVEAAFGADMVALEESKELNEKGFLASSCYPGFVFYIRNEFPDLLPSVPHNPSPVAALIKYIKILDASAKVVFVGPCTARKAEAQLEGVEPYVDAVITFEELQALYDSKEIDLTKLEDTPLDNVFYFERVFARGGGLTKAVGQALKERNIEFEVKPIVCDGIETCRMALLEKRKNVLNGNSIEGMVYIGGCIGGAGYLTHRDRNKMGIEKHGRGTKDRTISESLKGL